jgi:competence protein ComEC
VLLAWCAGTAAGFLGPWRPPAAFELVAAMVLALLAALAWAAERARDAARGWIPIRLSALLLALVVLVAGTVRGTAGRPPTGRGSIVHYVGQTVAVTGRVANAAPAVGGDAVNPASRLQSFRVAARTLVVGDREAPVEGEVLVEARGHAEVFDGQSVQVEGRLNRLRQLGPGGAAGYADRLERAGVVAEMPAGAVQPLGPPPVLSISRPIAKVRQQLVKAARESLPEPEATLVLGEVAGIRAALPPSVDADLVDSGLVHILAISGIKVAIIAGLLQAVALPLFGRRGAVVSIGGIAAYTLVGGATASAVRSALMGSLGLLGAVLRRDTDMVRSLLLAAAMMLGQRPALVADLSFQYSFLGVLGIHLFAERIAGRVRFVPQPFREALAVTTAAQLGTLPLTAHYFHVVPLTAPLTNAAVLPTLPLAMVGGLLIAALHWAAGLAPGALVSRVAAVAMLPVAALVFVLARLTLLVAHAARSVPAATVAASTFGGASTVAYYLGASVVVAGQSLRWSKMRLVVLAAGAALAVLLVMGRPDGRLHVEYIGGVTGPTAVVVAPDGATMLIGTGASAAALGPALDPALPPAAPLPGLPRRLDALALTGSAREESGGLSVVSGRRVGLAIVPEGMTGSAATDGLARLVERGAQAIRLRPGDRLPWHELDLVAHAGGAAGELALEVRWGKARVLLVSSADARSAPEVPEGEFQAVGLGSGAAEPGMAGVGAARIVVQNGGGTAAATGTAAPRPLARGLAQAPGGRLWETSRDGALSLSCDQSACRQR